MKKRFISMLLILCMALTMLPTTVFAANSVPATLDDGWYYLNFYLYFININHKGNAELNSEAADYSRAFYVKNMGNNQITLKLLDGRYLGVSDAIKDGTRLKAVDSPYLWNTYQKPNGKSYYSLRSPENTALAVSVSGAVEKDGTAITLWMEGMDTAYHYVFNFQPTDKPDPPKFDRSQFPNAPDDGFLHSPGDGWYNLFDTQGKATGFMVDFDGRAVLKNTGNNTWNPVVNKNFYVKNVGNNQITLKMLDGRYLGISGAIKDGVQLTAVDSPYRWDVYSQIDSDKKSVFSLRPPANPDMVINISGWNFEEGNKIILWTHKNNTPGNAWISFSDAEDWTKTITQEEMAHLFVNDIMGQFYAELPALPRVKEENESNNGIPERTIYKTQVFYLRRWGIIPLGDYNPDAKVTYGEFTEKLIKLMTYNKRLISSSGDVGPDFTKKVIEKFGIGGDTSAKAEMTMLQGKLLCDATCLWLSAVYDRKGTEEFPFPYPYAYMIPIVSAPGSVTIIKATETSAKCTWKTVKGASGYEIYFATSEEGTFKKAGSTKKELNFTKKSLKAGKKYYFKIRAYKTVDGKKVYGKYTKVKSIQM